MSEKKIIACLDTRDGRVVKGVKFVDIRDVGDPASLAAAYCRQGADEIVLLDIVASQQGRSMRLSAVQAVAAAISVPLTVGGGIASVEEAKALLEAGASKVSIGSAAVRRPALIREMADSLGSARVVAALDARRQGDGYIIVTGGGTVDTDIDAVALAREIASQGAGEILLTSVDADGMKTGYDIDMTRAIAEAVSIPVTASGGCGTIDHVVEVLDKSGAAAALVASLLHDGIATVPKVKAAVQSAGMQTVRYEYDRYFAKSDLIPAIVQQEGTGEVLMLAYMSRESLARTIETGETWFYSRSRNTLWHKGETSGHVQAVVNVQADCDEDTLLITVRQTGNACHTGAHSCFYRMVEK